MHTSTFTTVAATCHWQVAGSTGACLKDGGVTALGSMRILGGWALQSCTWLPQVAITRVCGRTAQTMAAAVRPVAAKNQSNTGAQNMGDGTVVYESKWMPDANNRRKHTSLLEWRHDAASSHDTHTCDRVDRVNTHKWYPLSHTQC
jgi:hypothetical protein